MAMEHNCTTVIVYPNTRPNKPPRRKVEPCRCIQIELPTPAPIISDVFYRRTNQFAGAEITMAMDMMMAFPLRTHAVTTIIGRTYIWGPLDAGVIDIIDGW